MPAYLLERTCLIKLSDYWWVATLAFPSAAFAETGHVRRTGNPHRLDASVTLRAPNAGGPFRLIWFASERPRRR
jgi:hypothetical protein